MRFEAKIKLYTYIAGDSFINFFSPRVSLLLMCIYLNPISGPEDSLSPSLCPYWHRIIEGISTDGKMEGRTARTSKE